MSYTGLSNKKKGELVEICEQLGLSTEGTIPELRATIKAHQDEHGGGSPPRSKSSTGRKTGTSPDAEDAGGEIKAAAEESVKKGRKSMNKAVQRVTDTVDASSIALPESPIPIDRLINAAGDLAENAQESLSVAIRPVVPEEQQRELGMQLHRAQGQVMKYIGPNKERIERVVDTLRGQLSQPRRLVATAVFGELVFLLAHVVQAYEHTVFFPPAGGNSGTLASLLHTSFSWFPALSLNIRYPEFSAFGHTSEIWPAIAWWAATTVLPPLALSTLVSRPTERSNDDQDGAKRTPSYLHADPLTFAFIRLAILLYPLTNGAPSSLVDSLKLSGDLHARALGAGLLVGILLAGRLPAR